jgi:AcrR family transcriptional regulator
VAETMTRRDRNAEATRHDILAAGHEIFSQQPYSEVSGVQICHHAGVTRGALQHHFGSKLGLFMAVFEGLQHDASIRITAAIKGRSNAWDRVRAGIAAFVDACAEPAYQMVVLKEGPAAIGWERWRELDTDYYAHLVRALIDMLVPVGPGDYASAMLGATLRGTLTELSFEIAQSADQVLARREALIVVDKLLNSLAGTPRETPPPVPDRIGIGQLRASASTYLDRVAAGETIDVLRRGRAVARLQPPPGILIPDK